MKNAIKIAKTGLGWSPVTAVYLIMIILGLPSKIIYIRYDFIFDVITV
jgi:hypothetical protein